MHHCIHSKLVGTGSRLEATLINTVPRYGISPYTPLGVYWQISSLVQYSPLGQGCTRKYSHDKGDILTVLNLIPLFWEGENDQLGLQNLQHEES